MALRHRLAAAAGPLAAAVVGGLATDPDSRWFRGLAKPSWYPPPQTFGVVWAALYAGTAWAAGEVVERSDPAARRAFTRAYAVNLLLNGGWPPLFFRAHRLWWSAAESAVLTASTVDLVRRAARVSGPAAAVLSPYAAWSAFATVLSAAIARAQASRPAGSLGGGAQAGGAQAGGAQAGGAQAGGASTWSMT